MSCVCGLRGEHFICGSCGIHVVTDFEPCPACSYFKFTPAQQDQAPAVAESLPVVEAVTSAPTKTKRRHRGAN